MMPSLRCRVSSLLSVQSVSIPNYDTTGFWISGYVYGATPLQLARTDAYADSLPVNRNVAVGIPVPRNLARYWYALPNFNSANYKDGKIRISMNYSMAIHRVFYAGSGYNIEVDSAKSTGSTAEYNTPNAREMETCASSLVGDTIWVRNTGVISNNAPATDLKCTNRNPFLPPPVRKGVDVVGRLMDLNGDGAADSVVLRSFNQEPAFAKLIGATVGWAVAAGGFDSVWIPGTRWSLYAGDSVMGVRLTLPVGTSCLHPFCTDGLGTVFSILGIDTVRNPIVLLADGIAPIADRAWLVAGAIGSLDTLCVAASETLVPQIGLVPAWDSAYIFTGSRSTPRKVVGLPVFSGGRLFKLLIDRNANPFQAGDSIRLGGLLGDTSGNWPGFAARWVPLEFLSVVAIGQGVARKRPSPGYLEQASAEGGHLGKRTWALSGKRPAGWKRGPISVP